MWHWVIWVLGVLGAGALYHAIAKMQEKKQYPPPGELFHVKDGVMHLTRAGNSTPPLVFSCGSGGFSLGTYHRIASVLSETYRTVLYDRFGYGWSSRTSRARTMENMNEELRELLAVSGEVPPYVLIGHSLGASEMLQFAQRHPSLVSGIVLLDAAYFHGLTPLKRHMILIVYGLLAFLQVTGILRIATKLKVISAYKKQEQTGLYPAKVVRLSEMMFYQRAATREGLGEIKELLNGEDLNLTLGSLPLLVISAEHAELQKTSKAEYQGLMDYHRRLASLSAAGRQVVLKDADHLFPIFRPDETAAQISRFLDEYRK